MHYCIAIFIIVTTAAASDVESNMDILVDRARSSAEIRAAFDAVVDNATPADLGACFSAVGEPVPSPWDEPDIDLGYFELFPPETDAGSDQDGNRLVFPTLAFNHSGFGDGFANVDLPELYEWGPVHPAVRGVRMRRDAFVRAVERLATDTDVSVELELLIPSASTEFLKDALLRAAVYVDSPQLNQFMHSVFRDQSNSDALRTSSMWRCYEKMIHHTDNALFDRWVFWGGLIQALYDGRSNDFERRVSGMVPFLRPDHRLTVVLMDFVDQQAAVGALTRANRHIRGIEDNTGHRFAIGETQFRDLSWAELDGSEPIYAEVLGWINVNRPTYQSLAADMVPITP